MSALAQRDLVRVGEAPIDEAALSAFVRDDGAGAVVSFLGTTRDSFVDETGTARRVVTLAYEAYAPMAERQLRAIVAAARARFNGLAGVAVEHRVGEVPVGQASVAVVVSAVHRAPAFEAVAWIMDELKATVPVWKREVYADGSVWKENPEARARLAAATDAAAGPAAAAAAAAGLSSVACCDPRRRLS